MRLIPQLITGISRVFQKLLKYFNGTIISTFFVPPAVVTSVIFYEALSLAVEESVIAPELIKAGSFL